MTRRSKRPTPKLGRIALERVYPPHDGRPRQRLWDLDIEQWTRLELMHAHAAIRTEVERRKAAGEWEEGT